MNTKAVSIPILGAMVLAPVAAGAVHTEVVFGLFVVVLSGFVIRNFGGESKSWVGLYAVSIPSLTFWGFAAICIVQIVPVPETLNRVLNPRGWQLFQEGWQTMFGQAPDGVWRPLSLDPGRTADRGLRWLTLGLASMFACSTAAEKGVVRERGTAFVVAGIVVVLAGSLHVVFDIESLLFLWKPEASLPDYTTFVNPNHASVFSGLSALAAFALALESGRRSLRRSVTFAIAGLVLFVMAFSYESGGGTVSLCVGLGVLFGCFLASELDSHLIGPRNVTRAIGWGTAAVGLAFPVLLALVMFLGPVWIRDFLWESWLGHWLTDGNTEARLELSKAALRGARDFPIVGAGGGATERALPPYIDWAAVRPATIPTVENEPAEWLFEYGVTGGLAGLCLCSYLLFAFIRYRNRKRVRYALGMGIVAFIALNAFFHFPFFTLGIGLPAVVLAETTLFPVRRVAEREDTFSANKWQRGVLIFRMSNIVVCTVFAVVGMGLFALSQWYDVDRRDLNIAENSEDSGEWGRFLRRIPSDGDLYAAVAYSSLERGESDRAVELVNYAFDVEPKANMMLRKGEILAAVGKTNEAIRSFREVYSDRFDNRGNGLIVRDWLDVVVRSLGESEHIAEALQDARPPQWRRTSQILRDKSGSSSAATFAIRLVELRPNEVLPYRLVVDAYIRGDRPLLAEMWARQLLAQSLRDRHGRQPAGYAALSRALKERGKRKRAWNVVKKGVKNFDELQELSGRFVTLAPSDPDAYTKSERLLLEKTKRSVCQKKGKWSRYYCSVAEARLAEIGGDFGRAQAAYRRASDAMERPDLLAEFLIRNGRCTELQSFLRDWNTRHPTIEINDKKKNRFLTQCADSE